MSAARLGFVLRLLLGSIFIFSAVAKLFGAGLFEIAIVDQGLAATREQAAYPARLLIAFELFLGTAMLFPYYLRRTILPLAMATLSAFILLQSYQFITGEQTQDCGCFGELLPMSSGESLLKNLILLGLSFWLFRLTKEEKRKGAIPALLAIASVALVFWLAPVRRNYDGNFARYTQFEKAGRVDLTEGNKLVAVFNAECEHCQETARELGALAANHVSFPQIYVLMYSENQIAVSAFSEKTNTHYPYHLISENEFFDLIGNTPPRLYWLQNGKIQARWDDEIAQHVCTAFNVPSAAALP